jgi:hypothetical protein
MRLSAFVIFVYGFTRLGRTPSVLDVAAALVLLAVALVILYSLSMTRSFRFLFARTQLHWPRDFSTMRRNASLTAFWLPKCGQRSMSIVTISPTLRVA